MKTDEVLIVASITCSNNGLLCVHNLTLDRQHICRQLLTKWTNLVISLILLLGVFKRNSLLTTF